MKKLIVASVVSLLLLTGCSLLSSPTPALDERVSKAIPTASHVSEPTATAVPALDDALAMDASALESITEKNYWPMPIGSYWIYGQVMGPGRDQNLKLCNTNPKTVFYVKPPSGAYKHQTSRTMHIYGENKCSYPWIGLSSNVQWDFQLADSIGGGAWVQQRGLLRFHKASEKDENENPYVRAPNSEDVSAYPFFWAGDEFDANNSSVYRQFGGRYRPLAETNEPYLFAPMFTTFPSALTLGTGFSYGIRSWPQLTGFTSEQIRHGPVITNYAEGGWLMELSLADEPPFGTVLKVLYFEATTEWDTAACEMWYYKEDVGPVRFEATSVKKDKEAGEDWNSPTYFAYCKTILSQARSWTRYKMNNDPRLEKNRSAIYELVSWHINTDTVDSHYANEEFGFDSPDAMAMTAFYRGNVNNPREITYIKDSYLWTIDVDTGDWLRAYDLTDTAGDPQWDWTTPEISVNVGGRLILPITDKGPEAMEYGQNVRTIFDGELIVFNQGAYWVWDSTYNSARTGHWKEQGRTVGLFLPTTPPAGLLSNGGPDAAVSAWWTPNAMVFYNQGQYFIWYDDTKTWQQGSVDVSGAPFVRGKQPTNPDAALMGAFLSPSLINGVLSDRQHLYAQEGGFWIRYLNADKDWESWKGTFAIQSTHSSRYVSSSGVHLQANSRTRGPAETFQFIDMGVSESGNVLVALKANNNKYVSASSTYLTPYKDKIEDWETFEIIEMANGSVAFKAHNGEYVYILPSDNTLAATGSLATFRLVPLH